MLTIIVNPILGHNQFFPLTDNRFLLAMNACPLKLQPRQGQGVLILVPGFIAEPPCKNFTMRLSQKPPKSSS